jgi:hypothetical protein
MSLPVAAIAAVRLAHLAGDVLAVAVDLDHIIVAVLAGVLEARLHRAADAEIEGQVDDADAVPLPRPQGGGVDGAVVDHKNIGVRQVGADLADDTEEYYSLRYRPG